jgi:hypothetical protein
LTSTAISDSAADGDFESLAVEYRYCLASDALVVAVEVETVDVVLLELPLWEKAQGERLTESEQARHC